MKVKHYILPIVVIALMSLVFLLPKAGNMSLSAVKMNIPEVLAGWETILIPPTEAELQILAKDTTFSKAICIQPRAGEYEMISGKPIEDRIDLSIVLSGYDLNNSIHRPERCMPSQGHTIGSSNVVQFNLANGKKITATRLMSVQSIPSKDKDEYLKLNCISYYFFIGKSSITHSHLERTLQDVKDRLFYGINQRWAYVSISMWYGNLGWSEKEISEREADKKLNDFIRSFAEENIDWNMISM